MADLASLDRLQDQTASCDQLRSGGSDDRPVGHDAVAPDAMAGYWQGSPGLFAGSTGPPEAGGSSAGVDTTAERLGARSLPSTGTADGRHTGERRPDPATVPDETVVVPESPAGIATGLTYLASAHRTTGPARSHPSRRDHPPLLRTGEALSIPQPVCEGVPDTGIEFRVPRSHPAVFVAAPLAFYLGATVTVDEISRPVVTATDADVRHEFSPLPTFQHEVARLLRRLFFLDCLVRRDDSGGSAREQWPDGLDLDPEAVRSFSPGGRLERYLDVPASVLDGHLPDWHLSTYARPDPSRAPCLPFLLDRLSLVYLPEASQVDASELLDRTLSAAYATRGSDGGTVDILEPEGGSGCVSSWLAPGTPINAFKSTPEAYRNRSEYDRRVTDRLAVTVVLNDETMRSEHVAVAETYRERAADRPIDVTVRERLTRTELAEVFASRNDFVHYIGHCDPAGLRCPDGHLDLSTLDDSRTRTFFLNACGSYEQGLALIERGSVAGAVTFTDVIDTQAATVGTAFARLFVHGFSIERAMQLARGRVLMGSDYAVVGDGTYALTSTLADPIVAFVDRDDDAYHVSWEVLTARDNGASYRLPGDREAFNGTRTEMTLDAGELIDALDDVSIPVVYEGDLDWSTDFVATLREIENGA
ncbi:MAG: hypothetical protein ABEH35_07315 [Haloarculaceae archaeon]